MDMYRGCFTAGTVLLILSISCMAWNVWRVVGGTRALWGSGFWVCLVFHAVTAVAAMALLDGAFRVNGARERKRP